MSLRLSSSQSAHFVSLWGGLGIPGSEVPTTGDNGGSPLANDGISPSSEYRIETVTPPSSGTLALFPDTSYEFSGAPDATYPWTYRVWEDSVDRGTAIEYLVVGSPVVAFSASPAFPAFSGSITIVSGSVEVSFDVTAAPPTFAGSVGMSPVVQTAAMPAPPTFSGVVTVGDGTFVWFDYTTPLPAFAGAISSGTSVSFDAVPMLPVFSGSITVVSGGFGGALSEEDVQRIAAAVWAHASRELTAINQAAIAAAVWGYEGP